MRLQQQYRLLTPEERFRLIMAAMARQDEAEHQSLLSAGGVITKSFPDHWPFAQAFMQLSDFTYLRLSDLAVNYLHCLLQPKAIDDDNDEVKSDDSRDELYDAFLALGYQLKARYDGWQLFCEQLSVPTKLLWEVSPGFDRLQHALELSSKAAFVAGGYLVWLNRRRPKGAPLIEAIVLTPQAIFDEYREAFQDALHWWNGHKSCVSQWL